MLEAIKKIFEKKISAKGMLKVQEEPFPDTTITMKDGNLLLTGYIPDSIPISKITDLQCSGETMMFIFENKKFNFESKNSNELYQKLKPLLTDKYIFKAEGVVYYIYNPETRRFDCTNKMTVKIIFDTNYYLRIEDDTTVQHYEQINTSTQYYVDKENRSFVWSVYNEGKFHTFSLEFGDSLDFLQFASKYVECCYKSVNDGGDFKYYENIGEAGGSMVRCTVEDDDDWTAFEEEFAKDNSKKNEFTEKEACNRHLIMGNNQVFVTRGSSLGVFDVEKDDLEFRTHIQNALGDPMKIITHNHDQSLLVQDKDFRDKLQVLDLNRGEVIEKWDIGENMNDYFDGVKYNNDGTLIGVSDYSLFRIDPRMKEKVAEKNTYKTKNEFSCGMATLSGDVAVATRKGDLRLYNKIDKRAKTLLPGFGDEILGIDTSKDGTMVLCTCKNYILVFSVGSDYSKPLGKDKPTPRRLQLKPQHLTQMEESVSFTTAKFDEEDSVIVTSTGRYVVKWRVSDVKKGELYNYSLKAMYDVIIDENFVRHGEDIVVALKDDVKKVNEEELRKPKRGR